MSEQPEQKSLEQVRSATPQEISRWRKEGSLRELLEAKGETKPATRLADMTPHEIVELRRRGDLDDLLRGEGTAP